MKTRYIHGGPHAGKSWMTRLLLQNGLIKHKRIDNNVDITVWIDEASSMDDMPSIKHIIDNRSDNE